MMLGMKMRSELTTKRVFDLGFAVPGLILLLPLMLVTAVLVKLSDGGSAIFCQTRIGRYGVPFTILKFRSMRVGCDKHGVLVTIGDDPRITPIGRYLRRSKIDELPQLINVLRGEMSLVGPRPKVARYTDMRNPDQIEVMNLMPGITDPASLAYRDEQAYLSRFTDPEYVYTSEVLPHKLQLNLEYARKSNVWTDFVVILRTLFAR